ncbi:MAG: putative bifunctional diguanylate cyclase/phosphodiesterase [Acidothermaceae bacterium]
MKRGLWKIALAVGLVAVGVYFTLPSIAAKDYMYSAIGVGSTVGVCFGVRLHRPGSRAGWYLLGAANACFVLGDGIFDCYDLVWHSDVPVPSVADALYLLGYPFLFAGVFRIGRAKFSRHSREIWADAAIVCVGALALSWQSLMSSYAHDNTISLFGKLVTMAYPIMDLGVLLIVAGALLSGLARRSADKIVILAIVAMLIADFVYDVLELKGTYEAGNPVDAGFLVNYVLIAVAALHPTMADPLARISGNRQPVRRWVPLVAVAGFVSPAILLLGAIFDFGTDVPVLASTSIVLFSLVVLRFTWLYGRARDQADLLAQRGESLQLALDAQRSLEDELRHQAFHDNLTGLPNRALLYDRVEHALASTSRLGTTIGVFFCDLDGFKAINDSLGHQTGDDVLVSAAHRLQTIVRRGDTVARLGGDEFAVLLDNVDSADVAVALAARIVDVLREPITIGDRQINLSVSVGVAFSDEAVGAEQLLSEADTAMYEAKASGKDRFSIFEPRMRSRLEDRVAITNAFHGAIERGEFFLEYQPQISLADGDLEGFEALVRWQHPTLGHIGPYRFIPLAEDTGFIVQLGRWVLEAACSEATAWPTIYGTALTLSVNLSARQLDSHSLISDVKEVLAVSGFDPRRLVLEITESALMVDRGRTAQTLAALRNLGIRIAIDDFGTGYSSLGYLHEFPVDVLKIDKSFVDPLAEPGTEGAAFVQMILRLARDLDMATVAEGVESSVQRDVLTQLHCQSAQGYLISRPLPVLAARDFIGDVGGRAEGARERTAAAPDVAVQA